MIPIQINWTYGVISLDSSGFFFENFSENGAKSGSGVIYTLIYQNENGMSYMQG